MCGIFPKNVRDPRAWRGQVYPLSSLNPVLDCPHNMFCHNFECILCKAWIEVCFANDHIILQPFFRMCFHADVPPPLGHGPAGERGADEQ